MRCPSCASHEMPLTVCPIACADARDVFAARTHVKPSTRRRTVMSGWYRRGDDGRYEKLAYYFGATAGRATAERATAGRTTAGKATAERTTVGRTTVGRATLGAKRQAIRLLAVVLPVSLS